MENQITQKSLESHPSSGNTTPNIMNMKIKQEPGTEQYENSSISVSQSQPFLGHYRMRSYSRIQNSSPDTAVCEVCQCEFPGYDALQMHKMAHFNTSHVCYVCDCYFWNTETLSLHMATIHRELNISNHNHKGETFVCNICLQRFSSGKTLVKHQTQHAKNDDQYFGCRVCGLDFIGYRALLAHLNSPRHKEMKVKIQSIFVCVDCRSIFASRDSYAMHMMVRAQNESCDSITNHLPQPHSTGTKLETKVDIHQSLTNGMKSMSGQNKESVSPLNLSTSRLDGTTVDTNLPMFDIPTSGYKCTMCSSFFPTQDALAMHAMAHALNDVEKERRISAMPPLTPIQYQCPRCLDHFPNSDSLAMHALVHAKNDTEGKNIGQVSTLRVLKNVSTRVRPSSAPLPVQQLGQKQPETCCIKCDISFDTRDEYAMHFIDKHIHRKSTAHSEPTRESLDCTQREAGIKRSHSVGDASVQALEKMRKLNHDEQNEKSVCNICKKYFDRVKLAEHELECKPVTNCSLCDMVFLDNYALRCHLRSQYHLTKQSAKDNKKHCCQICGFTTVQETQYLSHMFMHNPQITTSSRSAVRPSSVLEVKTFSATDPLERPHSTGDLESHSDSLVCGSLQVGLQGRRSRRKPLAAARVLPNTQSPEPSDNTWLDEAGQSNTVGSTVRQRLSVSPGVTRPLISPHGQQGSPQVTSRQEQNSPEHTTPTQSSPRPSNLQTHEDVKDADIVDYVLSNIECLSMCKFCKIIYTDQTVYYLHMGLHNLNNPWQCNLCGKVCRNVHEFSSHVIHY